jgi:protein-disulfide isomerase
MKRTLFATVFALSLCAPLAAQATRRTQPAARPAAPRTQPAARPTPAQTPAPGAPATAASESLPEVLAVVNGVKITSREIDEPIRQQVEQLQQEVTDARKREVDLQINSMLLEAEAKRRGVTADKLLEQEIVSKVPEPTAAEAQAFYNEKKADIDKQVGRATEFKDVQPNVVAYLRDQRQQDAAKAFADRLRAGAEVKVLVAEATPPATAADRARVFATVNGRQITSAMIEDSLRPLAYSAQKSIYGLRRQQLDLQINDLLLTQEAQKRGVTANALLDSEVSAKLKPVTEAEARAFYDQNKERINGDFAQIKEQIVSYLTEQQRQSVTVGYAERLRAAAAPQIFLRAPEPPVYEIATDDQPSKGSPTAPVTVVEFTDFQCPSCKEQAPVIERIAREYGERVRVVVRDYPLSMHANAFRAAEAAEAARAQGKYWEYTALLYANQDALEDAKLKEYALRAGLDVAKFEADLTSGRHAERVRRDQADGNRVGVTGTPTLFVNGRPVEDRTYEALKAAIDAALQSKAKG